MGDAASSTQNVLLQDYGELVEDGDSVRQKVDVLAVFNIGCRSPRPMRFKIVERGLKTTVNISGISHVEYVGAGGVTRIEYSCFTDNNAKRLKYKLLYFYQEGRWEVEMPGA